LAGSVELDILIGIGFGERRGSVEPSIVALLDAGGSGGSVNGGITLRACDSLVYGGNC